MWQLYNNSRIIKTGVCCLLDSVIRYVLFYVVDSTALGNTGKWPMVKYIIRDFDAIIRVMNFLKEHNINIGIFCNKGR